MNLHDRLEAVFQNIFNDDEFVLEDSKTAKDVAGWDSVAHINLMFAIEQEFRVQFSGNELADFANLGELKSWLAARVH
jgi:acyl carrier protein